METVAVLVHSLNRFSLCTKMAVVAVAKLLLSCDIICKRSVAAVVDPRVCATRITSSMLSQVVIPHHQLQEEASTVKTEALCTHQQCT